MYSAGEIFNGVCFTYGMNSKGLAIQHCAIRCPSMVELMQGTQNPAFAFTNPRRLPHLLGGIPLDVHFTLDKPQIIGGTDNDSFKGGLIWSLNHVHYFSSSSTILLYICRTHIITVYIIAYSHCRHFKFRRLSKNRRSGISLVHFLTFHTPLLDISLVPAQSIPYWSHAVPGFPVGIKRLGSISDTHLPRCFVSRS